MSLKTAFIRSSASAGDLLKNVVGRLGPDERLGLAVVETDVVVKSQLEIGNAGEDPTADAVNGEIAEEALDRMANTSAMVTLRTID